MWEPNITMKTILLVAAAFTGFATASVEWTELRVTFSNRDTNHTQSHFILPLNKTAALSAGWVSVDNGSSVQNLTTYCRKNDPRYCVFYDSYGKIAGFQIGIPYDETDAGLLLYYIRMPQYSSKIMFDKLIWAGEVYFVNPALEAGGHKNTKDLIGTEGVWIKELDEFLEVPRNETEIISTTNYKKGACISGMGTHYSYDMDTSMPCEDYHPWNFLVNTDGELIGLNYFMFGRAVAFSPEWYDNATYAIINEAFPESPECLTNWAIQYEIMPVYTHFVSERLNITC